MLTMEVKENGKVIAEARLVPCGGILNDGFTLSDDWDVQWVEEQGEGLEATRDADGFVIRGHRRANTVWPLVAKVVVRVLGQLADRLDQKPGQARIWDQAGREHK